MKSKKLKANEEPSPRAKLSQAFLEALEADFREYGKGIIERMREKDPTRYAELAGKLIMTTEPPPSGLDLNSANSLPELGRALLRAVGTAEDAMSDAAVEQAIKANDVLTATLESIKNKAEGKTH
jgi:hypothetical protein